MAIMNLADPKDECKYHLAEYNTDSHQWNKVKMLFPAGFLPSSFIDSQLDLLVMLRFISKQGNVDKQTIKNTVCAWCMPSGEWVQ